MEAKRRLAREIVARFHSVDAALEAEAEFNRVFRDNQIPADIPEVILTQEDLKDGRIWLVRLLVKAELVSSNGEGRRLIQQGGVRINGRVIDDVDYEWTPEQDAVIQIGKRRFARVRISE